MAGGRAVFLLLVLVLPACGGSRGASGGSGRATIPNVVLIAADDLGYADVGAHGLRSDILTPFIDSIAAAGVRCTNGYVSGPYCSPSRAGLLTGRYQGRFGHEFNPGGNDGLPVTEITLAERMRAAGYRTGLVGKWHLGLDSQFIPTQRGFEEFYGFLIGTIPSYYDSTLWRNTTKFTATGYLTENFSREAVDFIDRHRAEKFFLFLSFNAPHTPMDVPPPQYVNRFPPATPATERRTTYLAMLAAMDDAVGAVLAKLRAENLERDTLVIFISDNGGATEAGTTVNGSVNLPLRAGKKTLYEGGIRVPYFVKWPARLPAGAVYHNPVIQLDLFTTAITAAGGAIPTDRVIDGVDLLPYLSGASSGAPHRQLYWRFGNSAATRSGNWKLHNDGALVSELYDIAVDIGESTDLVGLQPAVRAELEADLAAWKAQLIPPLW